MVAIAPMPPALNDPTAREALRNVVREERGCATIAEHLEWKYGVSQARLMAMKLKLMAQ